jgi:hypothetical protein
MRADVLPDEVKAFLLCYIDAIAQLEALLLLRANADLAWSAAMLALRLYISVQETAEILVRLCADGFLAAQDNEPLLYQYHCLSRDQAHMVDQVAMLYTTYLIPVTPLMHAKPRTRVQGFALSVCHGMVPLPSIDMCGLRNSSLPSAGAVTAPRGQIPFGAYWFILRHCHRRGSDDVNLTSS